MVRTVLWVPHRRHPPLVQQLPRLGWRRRVWRAATRAAREARDGSKGQRGEKKATRHTLSSTSHQQSQQPQQQEQQQHPQQWDCNDLLTGDGRHEQLSATVMWTSCQPVSLCPGSLGKSPTTCGMTWNITMMWCSCVYCQP